MRRDSKEQRFFVSFLQLCGVVLEHAQVAMLFGLGGN
jgi:hypothetical protein